MSSRDSSSTRSRCRMRAGSLVRVACLTSASSRSSCHPSCPKSSLRRLQRHRKRLSHRARVRHHLRCQQHGKRHPNCWQRGGSPFPPLRTVDWIPQHRIMSSFVSHCQTRSHERSHNCSPCPLIPDRLLHHSKQQPQHVTQPIITDPRLLQQQNPSLFSQNLQGQNFQHQQLSILPRTPAPTAAASSIPSAGFSPQSQSPSQRFVSQPDQTFSPGPPPFSDASVPVFASNRVSSLGAQQQQAGQQLGSQAQGSAFQSQFLQPQAAPQAATSPQGLTPSQLAALNFFQRRLHSSGLQSLETAASNKRHRRRRSEPNKKHKHARSKRQTSTPSRKHRHERNKRQRSGHNKKLRLGPQQEAAVRAQQEAQARAQQEATLRAQQQEAAQRSAAEARLRQQQEANARANADAALKQQREAQAAREAAIRAQQQADAAVARYRALLQRTQEPQPQPAQPTAQPQPQPQPQQFQPSQPQDPFSGQLDFQVIIKYPQHPHNR